MIQGQVIVAGASEPPAGLIAVVVLATLFFLGWLFAPLVRALARRIEGRASGDGLEEVAELRHRIQELELKQERIHELEERLDFAERLLSQSRDQARLPGG